MKQRRKVGDVTVTRPDPQTGELVREVVKPSRFKRSKCPEALSLGLMAEILSGSHPALVWHPDSPCPVEAGEEITVQSFGGASQVILTITRIKRGKKGEHMAEYRVRDDRPEYLRHNHGTTRSPADSVDPEAPMVDAAFQEARSQEGELTTLVVSARQRQNRKVEGLEAKRSEALHLEKTGRVRVLTTRIERHQHEAVA